MSEQQRIVVTGNPIDGFTFYGPFDSFEDAEAYADKTVVGFTGDWWICSLQSPEVEGEQLPGQQELPLHYPGAAVPIPPVQ